MSANVEGLDFVDEERKKEMKWEKVWNDGLNLRSREYLNWLMSDGANDEAGVPYMKRLTSEKSGLSIRKLVEIMKNNNVDATVSTVNRFLGILNTRGYDRYIKMRADEEGRDLSELFDNYSQRKLDNKW